MGPPGVRRAHVQGHATKSTVFAPALRSPAPRRPNFGLFTGPKPVLEEDDAGHDAVVEGQVRKHGRADNV